MVHYHCTRATRGCIRYRAIETTLHRLAHRPRLRPVHGVSGRHVILLGHCCVEALQAWTRNLQAAAASIDRIGGKVQYAATATDGHGIVQSGDVVPLGVKDASKIQRRDCGSGALACPWCFALWSYPNRADGPFM